MNKELSIKIKNISLILTILVVLGHAYNLESKNYMGNITVNTFTQKFLSYGVSTIAVPIFFIISGYLFFFKFESTVKNWLEKYKRRFKSLVVPFILWCVGWMLILYVIQLTSFGKDFFKNMIVSNFTLDELFKYTFKYPIPFQLWYIYELMKIVVISPVIYYCIRIISKASCPTLILLWILGYMEYPIVFFGIGSYLAINEVQIDKRIDKKYIVILGAVFFIALLFKTKLSYSEKEVEILSKIVIVFGILLIWYWYDRFNINYTFNIAKYSIFIYFFHEPLQSFIYRVAFKVIERNQITEFILYILVPIIVILISIETAIVLKKYFKNLYYVLTGGR